MQVFLALVDEVAIVHVPAIAPDAADFLDVMVKPAGRCQGEGLAYLTAQAQAHIPEHINEMLRQGYDPLVRKLPPHDVLANPMGNPVEELAEVELQDVSLRPVLPVVLPEVLAQAADGEVVALVFQTGGVVIDEGPGQHGDQGVVTEATLDHTFVDGHASDVSLLPSFVQVELMEAAGLELPLLEPVVSLERQQGRLGDVLLGAGFPGHTPAAFPVGCVQVLIGEYGIEVIKGRVSSLLLSPFCYSALVTGLPSFFAGHPVASFQKKNCPRTAAG